jgi:hypothetical protein
MRAANDEKLGRARTSVRGRAVMACGQAVERTESALDASVALILKERLGRRRESAVQVAAKRSTAAEDFTCKSVATAVHVFI